MACGKDNSNGCNIRSFRGSHLSNNLAASAPIFSWSLSQGMCTTSRHAMKQQLGESPAQGMPDMLRVLASRATGMAWSDALSKRVSNYYNQAHGHQRTESLDLAEIAMEVPNYIAPLECASSSCIRTAVSSEGTNSCEFSDHDFSTFHHGSTASLASSDHSSMAGSTSELLQDDMDVLNYVQSGVSLPLMEIVSSSDAHMGSVNSNGELLNMCKQEEKQLKIEDQLHKEINVRLTMIRSCCKECNEDAGIAKKSSNSTLESLQVASSTGEERVCTVCDTPTNVKDYLLMRKHGLHDLRGVISHQRESFHMVHNSVPFGRVDVVNSELTRYDSAAVSQLACADVHTGLDVAACCDVACNVVHPVHDMAFAPCSTGDEVAACKPKQYEVAFGNADVEEGDIQGMLCGKAAIDDMADEVDVHCSDVDAEVEAEVEGGSRRGVKWQGSNMRQYRTAEDHVVDEVANKGGQVGAEVEGWQQGLTWQEATSDDVDVDVLYGAEVDAQVGEALRTDSHGGNNKMREMMYRVAAYQPIDWESIMEEVVGKERPRRRNVRISKEPQSIAARRRRERISDRIRILQRLVPGTSKLDTASMLDEAIHYLKFLKLQVQALRSVDRIFTSGSLPLPSDFPFHVAPPYHFLQI